MTSYRYPPRGVQFRKAAVALKVTAIFLCYLAPIMACWGPEWKNRMQRIARRHAECGKAIVGWKASVGARREIEAQAAQLDRHLEKCRTMDKAETPRMMGAFVVAIGALVCDALCTAPAVTHKTANGGNPKPDWQRLNRLMDELADDMTQLCPGCDELGTTIYMEISR